MLNSKTLFEVPLRFILSPQTDPSKPFFEVPQLSEMDKAQEPNHFLVYFTRVHSKEKSFYECISCKQPITGPKFFKRHLLAHARFNENQNLVQNFEKSGLLNQVKCRNCSQTFHFQKAVKHMTSCHKKRSHDIRKNLPTTSSFELRVSGEDEPNLQKKIKVENTGNPSLCGHESRSLLNQITRICKRYRDLKEGTSGNRKLKMELRIILENYYAIMENESRSLQKTIEELQRADVKGDNEILRKKVGLLKKANESLQAEYAKLKESNQILQRKVDEQADEIEECKRIIEEKSMKVEKQNFSLALYMKNLEMLRLNYEEEVESWQIKYQELLQIFVERKYARDHEIRALLRFFEKNED